MAALVHTEWGVSDPLSSDSQLCLFKIIALEVNALPLTNLANCPRVQVPKEAIFLVNAQKKKVPAFS